jgi:membrane protein YqaA with SNARE-associated domain
MTPDQAARAAVELAEETHVHLATPARHTWRSILGLVLGLLVLGGLSAAFLLYPTNWQIVGRWGYLGVGAVVFVATASIALPIPYLLIVARAGTYLDPVMIGLVAGLAGMLGEMTGYLIGISGSRIIPHGRWYDRARGWICNYGFWCIAFFACVPNPVFDAVGVLAGILGYSWRRFALACFLGKFLKFLIAALVGVEIARHNWGV